MIMQKKISIEYFKTPVGELVLGSTNNKLCLCDWRYRKMRETVDKRIQTGLDASFIEGKSDIIEKTKALIKQYFKGEKPAFNIPLLLVGTEFQKTVWKALLKIPYGTTESYLGLSKKIGNEKAIRAVASANGANAISIFVPCHRIIGNDNNLIGYAGGLAAKKKLLQIENALDTDQLTLF